MLSFHQQLVLSRKLNSSSQLATWVLVDEHGFHARFRAFIFLVLRASASTASRSASTSRSCPSAKSRDSPIPCRAEETAIIPAILWLRAAARRDQFRRAAATLWAWRPPEPD